MTRLYQDKEQNVIAYQWLFVIITIAGIALRLYWHFGANRPLWEDEAHIALNFICYNYAELTRPLAHFQMAPVLFLFGVETFSTLWGNSEVVLRSFPFLISLFCFPLLYHLAYYITRSRLSAIIAFSIFTFNTYIIHYSSELKPYTIELSMYILILYLLLSENRFVTKYRMRLLAIVGGIGVLMANATHLVLVIAGLYMVTLWVGKNSDNLKRWKINRRIVKQHGIVFMCWGAAIVFNYMAFLYKHPYAKDMKITWHNSFVPPRPFAEEFAAFMANIIDDTFFRTMLQFSKVMYFPYLLLAVVIVAIIYSTIRFNAKVWIFLIVPVVLHIALSMEKIYPLYGRFYLYLLPAVIIIISIGISVLVSPIFKKLPVVVLLPLLYVAYCTVRPSMRQFTEPGRDIVPVLNYINQKPAHKLLITTPATLYEYYFRTGKAKNRNFENICWGGNPASYDSSVADEHNEYMLLCSTGGHADGLGPVLEYLQQDKRIIEQLDYGSYSVLLLKPLPAGSATTNLIK